MLATNPRLTPNLELRPFKRRDLDSLLDAVGASLPTLNEWLPWAHMSYGRRDGLIFLRDSVTAWGEGRAYDFTIRSRDDPGPHLGNVSVWYTSRQSSVGEVGYWIRSDESGKGIATEATARTLEIGFDEMELHRIVLRIAVGNDASERVAQKLGFTREGLLRQELKVRGRWLDHTAWGLLEEEYRKKRSQYADAGWVTSA
jgi:ribosomal-protein-serine acetyltransferase